MIKKAKDKDMELQIDVTPKQPGTIRQAQPRRNLLAKNSNVSFRMSPETLAVLTKACAERNISLQGWLEEATDAKMRAEGLGEFKKN